MHASIARLTQILPPHPGAGDEIDWKLASEQWGTRFPADYRDFVASYGAGSINGWFGIGLPLALAPEPDGPLTFEAMTQLGFDLLDPESTVEIGGRICWALDDCANHAFWDTTDADPDKWTVVVLKRHGEWIDYGCSMSEFLLSMLAREIDPAPMALIADDHPARFLNWREEQRRHKAGIYDHWAIF